MFSCLTFLVHPLLISIGQMLSPHKSNLVFQRNKCPNRLRGVGYDTDSQLLTMKERTMSPTTYRNHQEVPYRSPDSYIQQTQHKHQKSTCPRSQLKPFVTKTSFVIPNPKSIHLNFSILRFSCMMYSHMFVMIRF